LQSAKRSKGFFAVSDIRFLIADDNASVQTFLTQLLESYGFDPAGVKTTATPETAAELIARFEPDFLLTDWFDGSSLSGLALAEVAKTQRPDSRFAMLCKAVTPQMQEQAQAAGALFLLAKPFTANQLRMALRAAMEKMAVEHPKMAAHVNAQAATAATAAAAQSLAAQSLAKRAALPPIRVTQHKPGDTVFYQGRPAKVKYVILRRGELVMQLDGHSGLIAANEVRAG
jgi:DNA-binding NtrC family response regulator